MSSPINLKNKNKHEPPKKIIKNKKPLNDFINSINIANNNSSKDHLTSIRQNNIQLQNLTNKINQNNYYIKNQILIYKCKCKNTKKNINSLKKSVKSNLLNKNKISRIPMKLNDEELNNLTYKKAIELDKRTYFQYYWALLKKKHMILFTFIAKEDYNLRIIKIALFTVSFSLYFTINGFFSLMILCIKYM